ncbi:unnamed protein product [Rhizoctonia solani]|uniref:DNA polymerase lambda n=1 Tax=Rhizoctonia solani TaxID=456999 RepID=A0A8H2WRD0_9AGAM|nr:unnamed protein product [Rhizoctonia solani]
MTLSSLFNSLDRLDETNDDEEDFSGLYLSPEPANNIPHCGFHSRKRTHMCSGVDENADSKRAKIFVLKHASSTLQPRHGGTGAPLDETTGPTPVNNITDTELYPAAVQFPSSASVSKVAEPDRVIQTAEPSPSSSPPNSCSNSGAAFAPIESENNQPKTALHEPTETVPSMEVGRSRVESGQASVAESAPVATRSKPDASQPIISKPVSRPAYNSSTIVARPRAKDQSSCAISSNSFRDSGSVASRRDNHVAQGASASFGAQITLVSRKSRHPAQSGQSRGPKDAKTQCTTISEFASYLQTQSRDTEANNKKQKPIFRDLIVYYAAKDPGKKISHSTKRRMEILSKLSAKVVGSFDSSVTHIVSDLPEKPLLEVLGVNSVEFIPPSVWVVDWSWVTKSMNSSRCLEETPYERFHKRLVLDNRQSHASRDNRRSMSLGADDVTETGSEISSREEFEPEGGEQSASVSGGLSICVSSAIQAEAPSDPLGSLVALVREMTHGQFSSERSSSPEIPGPEVLSRRKDSTNTTHSKPYPRPHGNGFACMTGNTVPAAPCLNQALVDELSRLRDIYEAKKHEDPSNQFRVLNYTKAIRSITKHPTKITSVDQVSHLPGVGAGIAEKISEFIATGCVAKIAAQTTEDLAVGRLFQGIYGVGPQTAHSWYVRGLRTLTDVRNRVDGIIISPAQELGLQYYTDLQRRMPRSEAAEIFERIKAAALQLDPVLDIEIMGSFRRGKPTCGDIDILITRLNSDGGSHRGIQKLLSHDLALPDDENELEAKYMGLCQLHSDTLMRRIDILTIPCEQWGSALLYFTGDDLFNRSMRLLARKNGMSLNQRGLFKGVIRDPKTQKKTNNGKCAHCVPYRARNLRSAWSALERATRAFGWRMKYDTPPVQFCVGSGTYNSILMMVHPTRSTSDIFTPPV